jgi:hypothetical protein
VHYELDTLTQIREVRQRLSKAEARAKTAEALAKRASASERKARARLMDIKQSMSWRATAPLRWIQAALRRLR